ncbi:Alpha/Beta hydrolase protein [Elsinoe ampelina]|uniref:Alpha/Beta hydrolase protein n=1 Tax=Elsinoe ampelina TaxID=302913 RepID=A0A6A6GGQ4_9PEZI|nr:Alpha/Beta hydrolase protein [Elsinoe ampelina]
MLSSIFAIFLFFLVIVTALPSSLRPNGRSQLKWGTCDDILEVIAPPNGTSRGELGSGLECATLRVPMDYTNPDSPPLHIDLVKSKAASGWSRGSILTNPGGPGGSGVEAVIFGGAQYQGVLEGQFDFIGFDVRGTGRTLTFDCQVLDESMQGLIPIAGNNMTRTLLDGGWARAEEYAAACRKAKNDTGSFLSTVFVARDMLEISRALGDDKVNYYGISYGTHLGQTFASLFPDNVGRFVLDSVVNSADNVLGPKYTWLDDTDELYAAFFTECLAFPSCPLLDLLSFTNTTIPFPPTYDPSSPASIATALQQYVNTNIIATLSLPGIGPAIYRSLKIKIFSALYSPNDWPDFARTLTHNITSLQTSPPNTSFPIALVPNTPWNPAQRDAFFGISCLDTPFRVNSAEELIPVAQRQGTISFFADAFLDYATWPCAAWEFEPPQRFVGPFGGKTATPILFVNNRLDPITPLASARDAASRFEGSRLLVGNGFGHNMLADPSDCTIAAVKAYFLHGTLPDDGTVCEPASRPFDPARKNRDVAAGVDSDVETGANRFIGWSNRGRGW